MVEKHLRKGEVVTGSIQSARLTGWLCGMKTKNPFLQSRPEKRDEHSRKQSGLLTNTRNSGTNLRGYKISSI